MDNKKENSSLKLFLKSLIYTVSVLALLAIGYFSAKYFFGT